MSELDPSTPENSDEKRDLSICVCCDKDFMQLIYWEESGATDWWMILKCANCGWREEVIADQKTSDKFDERLDEIAENLEKEYERFYEANMNGDIERFIGALDAGAILPEDF